LDEADGVSVEGQGVGETVPLSVGAHENVESIKAKTTIRVGRVGFVFFMGERNFNSIAIFARLQVGTIRLSGLYEKEVELSRRMP
jgi:hypothetical protein